MIIKVLPNQIPQLWDAIKFAAVSVDRIGENERPLYLNRLLAALLNDTAQCFVRMNGERQLQGIAITRFTQDEVTGERSLFINCLYSFQGVDRDQWESDFAYIREFAKVSGCKNITAYSNNPRVFEIVESVGFKERYRCFITEV